MKNYVDLHMHSNCSDDGDFTPAELVRKCKEAGVQVMSITDHNSARGNAEAKVEARKLGVDFITGIEIDCTYKDVNLHLLGYGIDDLSADIKTLESRILAGEKAASFERLALTQKLSFDVTEAELNALSNISDEHGTWTGEMFAEVLLDKKEYLNHPLLEPYRKNGERSDNPFVNFYWDFYSQGKPCYAKVEFPKIQEAVDIIRSNGGKAVLAHPGNNLKNCFELFDELFEPDIGIKGVEVFCSYHDKETAEYFYKKAMEFSLIITCGSDYHGKTKPSVKLGKTGCRLDRAEMDKQIELLTG